MAVFGNLEKIKSQVETGKFTKAFEYLDKVLKEGSIENERLVSLSLNAFEKVDLDENNFGLEQVYLSKQREQCFFESHQQYIDVQFILEGEEIIEVCDSSLLEISTPYNKEMDLIKYKDIKQSSCVRLSKGDVAIFYPEDAHMPCVCIDNCVKIIKTVVKVRV